MRMDESDTDVKHQEWHEFFEQAQKIKTKTVAPAAYKEIMEDKIVEGYEYLPISKAESCHKHAEHALAHMHPNNVCEYGDWRLYRIEDLPPEMEHFERKSGTHIPRDE
jgi:hypothetical protein